VSNRRVVLPGVILGVLVLALAAVFAIVLPKVNGENDTLSLPDTLPGGYTAVDLEKAYASAGSQGATDDDITKAAAAARNERTFGDDSLDGADMDAVTRAYASKDLQTGVFVQLYRAAGGALSPYQFSVPKNAQAGESIQQLVRKGDVVCIENGSADGQGSLQTSFVQCQKSEGEMTVQVTTSLELDKAVDLTDTVFDQVA
jgi:hypothetical protein